MLLLRAAEAEVLEICIFLGRSLKPSQVRTVMPASRSKFANLVRVIHRDQVEPPLTDWLAEAYAFVERPPAKAVRKRAVRKSSKRA